MAFTTDKAYSLIESAHEKGRLAHAFIISGEPGSGKSDLVSRVISLINQEEATGEESMMGFFDEMEPAKAPEVKSLDEQEGDLVRIIRPQSKSRRITVQDIRHLEKSFYTASAPGKWKVGVILSADRMGLGAENAFLKTLEEPPTDCLLLLVTDAPELLLPTILSRCVKLPLMTVESKGVLNDAQQSMINALADTVQRSGKLDSVAAALSLRAAFSKILSKQRNEISKANDSALKEETKKYKNTTDGDWLAKREKFYLANTESEYLNERGRLLEVLILWMGDVVRQKCGVERLDYSLQKEITLKVANAHELHDLLSRMTALEELRANMETNASEQLALEVAFLSAFG